MPYFLRTWWDNNKQARDTFYLTWQFRLIATPFVMERMFRDDTPYVLIYVFGWRVMMFYDTDNNDDDT